MNSKQIELITDFSWEYKHDPMDIFLVMDNKLNTEFEQWLKDKNICWEDV